MFPSRIMVVVALQSSNIPLSQNSGFLFLRMRAYCIIHKFEQPSCFLGLQLERLYCDLHGIFCREFENSSKKGREPPHLYDV